MIWLIGNKGMLGTEISLLLKNGGYSYIGTDREVDITDINALREFIKLNSIKNNTIEWIINCAAYTAVDKAEDDKETCHLINIEGSRNIAIIANEINSGVIYFSTDYVFNGYNNTPYKEDDKTDPIGVYGLTKRYGEVIYQEEVEKHYIVRSAWFYSKYGDNFVNTMMRLMKEKECISVVNDQKGSPTWVKDLALVIIYLINKTDHGIKIPYGIYNFTNEGDITWFDFAKEIYKQARAEGILSKTCEIKPCSSGDFPSKVKRPAYSVLDKTKIKNTLGINIPAWDESLKTFFNEIKNIKKILVTGAGGYIGRHVVQKLLEYDIKVIATDLYVDEIDKRAQVIKADIFSESENIFSELGSPDVCIHMAWKDGFVHNSNAHMSDLSKHYNFLRKMLEGGIKQLTVMGTMHEVGYFEGAIDENTLCNPISMYGIAKDALRRSINLLVDGKDIVLQWLRAYYIYGDDKKNNSIFAKLLLAVEEGKTEFPFTTGKNKYDFIHVDELAKQIAACAVQSEINGVINCCSGKPVSLADRVEGFIKEHKLNIKLKYGAFPDRQYDSPGIWGNNDKIKKILKI